MKDFKDLECCVCKVKFLDDTKIVFCPQCGAPYHKDCYDSIGHCIYQDVHGTDKAYKATKSSKIDPEKIKTCPNCAAINSKESIFCNKCGFQFSENQGNVTKYNGQEIKIPLFLDPMGGVDPNEKIGDTTSGEIAKFVRANTPYYLPNFKKIKENKKSKFNFSAFLFSGAWFLYRKQYKIGIILTTILFSLMILSSFIEYSYVVNILQNLLKAIGVASTADLTSEKYSLLFDQIQALDLSQKILVLAPTIIKIINLIIMIFSGIFANKIYLKHCTKTIKKIKEESITEKESAEKMQVLGGINLKIFPFILICYLIIKMFPYINL